MELKFAVVPVSLMLLLMPITASAQSGMAYELAGDGETYASEYIYVSGIRYKMVNYQRGGQDTGSIVLDGSGNLVTDSSQLNEIYGIKAYQELFLQNGVTTTKYYAIHSTLSDLYTSTKNVEDVMIWLSVVATVLGIASILIGGEAIPIAVIVGTVTYATHYIAENIQTPLNTASELRTKMSNIGSGYGSTSDYEEILMLNDQLRNELEDINNQFILDVAGFGKTTMCSAINGIADGIDWVASDTADDLRNWASNIEQEQKELDETLTWLGTIQSSYVIQSATNLMNDYVSNQNSRITTRQSEFNTKLNNIQMEISSVTSEVNGYGFQGADITVASSLLSQANSKTESAQNILTQYKFRTASSTLDEALSLAQDAKTAGSISLIISQAEETIDEVQGIINQKSSAGADVSEAISALNNAKTYVRNAKMSLSSISFDSARAYANNALSYAGSAKTLASNAVIPTPTPSPSPTPTVPPTPIPTPPTPGFGAVFAIVGLLAVADLVRNKRRW